MTGGGRLRLSAKQRTALDLIRQCADHDDGWAVVCSQGSGMIDEHVYDFPEEDVEAGARALADEQLGYWPESMARQRHLREDVRAVLSAVQARHKETGEPSA